VLGWCNCSWPPVRQKLHVGHLVQAHSGPSADLSAYDIQVHAGDMVIFLVGNSAAAVFYMQSAAGTPRDRRAGYPAGASDRRAKRSQPFNAYVSPAAGPAWRNPDLRCADRHRVRRAGLAAALGIRYRKLGVDSHLV
jgi:hypothetical protein